ncbi:hypothetical protein FD754_015096 [Muntiacus muntjak]|uniref:Beta-catenin-like protein 1 n=1 Tax=Muntiacus muntjak TaxID=9888 RepID=A0A5N3VLQ8_MUNMU|nr:hypothetical protein FD754_015096 [Muntiacus muntjak]
MKVGTLHCSSCFRDLLFELMSHKQAVVEYSQQEMMVLCASYEGVGSRKKRWNSGCNLKVQLTRFLSQHVSGTVVKNPPASARDVREAGSTLKHVCSILASLLRNLRGQQRTRLLNKFTENDSEKVDRLMELHFKYLDAVQVADKKIEGEKHDMVRRGEIIDNDIEDEFYLRRLDAGLFVLQHICYIMAEICNANVPQIRQRVHQILNMRGSSIKIVRHIIKGDVKSPGFWDLAPGSES